MNIQDINNLIYAAATIIKQWMSPVKEAKIEEMLCSGK